jgi:hypothetical protein
MATTINIAFNDQMYNFAVVRFEINNADTGYYQLIDKLFTTNIPTNSDQVQIGPTVTDSVINLFNNLVQYHTTALTSFSQVGNTIEIIFAPQGNYLPTVLFNALGRITILPTLVDDILKENIFSFFDINYFSIQIIDTTGNLQPYEVNLTGQSNPVLSYDAGDDLFNWLMSSSLSFNLYVPSKQDAYFKHLFTGDENRYKVQLFAINPAAVVKLIWQGYLLPDQYEEPFQSGPFFVDFKAIDRVATLKQKFLPTWYYQNRLPMIEVIALALQEAKLDQPILVDPTIVNANALYDFTSLNIDLKPYNIGGKTKDLYEVLKDVLTANLLTIKSYAGYWFIQGFSQKRNAISYYKKYDVNGKYLNDVTYYNTFKTYSFLDGENNLNLKTPLQEVEVDFSAEGERNAYETLELEISNKDIYSTASSELTSLRFDFVPVGVTYPAPSLSYFNLMVKDFINHVSLSYFIYRREQFFNNIGGAQSTLDLRYGISTTNSGLATVYSYNVSEATALQNYYEIPLKAFIKENQNYKLTIEIEVTGGKTISNTQFVNNVNAGLYDTFVPFQLLVNNVEIAGKTNVATNNSNTIYDISNIEYRVGDAAFIAIYKIEVNFLYKLSGNGVLRILVPIYNASALNVYASSFQVKNIDLQNLDEYFLTENSVVTRDINFSEKFKYETKLISSS